MDYGTPMSTTIHGNSQEQWILLGGCLTVKNFGGSLTGDDGADHEISVNA